jgi:hypothetical protein
MTTLPPSPLTTPGLPTATTIATTLVMMVPAMTMTYDAPRPTSPTAGPRRPCVLHRSNQAFPPSRSPHERPCLNGVRTGLPAAIQTTTGVFPGSLRRRAATAGVRGAGLAKAADGGKTMARTDAWAKKARVKATPTTIRRRTPHHPAGPSSAGRRRRCPTTPVKGSLRGGRDPRLRPRCRQCIGLSTEISVREREHRRRPVLSRPLPCHRMRSSSTSRCSTRTGVSRARCFTRAPIPQAMPTAAARRPSRHLLSRCHTATPAWLLGARRSARLAQHRGASTSGPPRVAPRPPPSSANLPQATIAGSRRRCCPGVLTLRQGADPLFRSGSGNRSRAMEIPASISDTWGVLVRLSSRRADRWLGRAPQPSPPPIGWMCLPPDHRRRCLCIWHGGRRPPLRTPAYPMAPACPHNKQDNRHTVDKAHRPRRRHRMLTIRT